MSLLDHVPLGQSGITASRLGIGAGYGISAAACERAYHEYGINYFYPSLPRRGPMSKAIRNLAKTERDKIVVVIQSYDHFGPFINRTFSKLLRKLTLEYADILLLGWFNRIPPRSVLDYAHRLKEQGTVRAIAMSGHNRPLFAKLAQMPDNPIDIFMIRYNAKHTGAEQDIFPYLPEKRPGMIAYTATSWAQLLNGRKTPDNEPPLTAGDCYRFVLSNPNIDMSLCGPGNEKQLIEACEALKKGPLNEDEEARARRIGSFMHG